MNFVEIFSGSGTMSKVARSYGFETFTIDKRRRKGVCEPDLKIDLMYLKRSDIPFEKVNALWVGLPCDAFSHAGGDYYYSEGEYTENASEFLYLTHKSTSIINELKPDLVFIENPYARLRKYRPFVEFCGKSGIVHHLVTMGSYGFPTPKPTSIFTNCLMLSMRPIVAFGRGSNSATGEFDNLTKVQRQSYPEAFCEDILTNCVNYLHGR